MNDPREDPIVAEAESLELLVVNLKLWGDLSDEAFDLHFRRRYFGEEQLSRTEAIARLKNRIDALTINIGISSHTAPDRVDLVREIQPQNSLERTLSSADRDFSLNFHSPELISAYHPFYSVFASVAIHIVIAFLLSLIRINSRHNTIVDFDKEHVTFYKVTQQFPSVAPSPSPSEHRKPALPVPNETHKTDVTIPSAEVSIHLENPKNVEIIVEQPNLSPVESLPKLVLPNILLKSAKTDPGRAPLILEKAKFDTIEEPLMDHSVDMSQSTLSSDAAITQRMQLALPAQPNQAVTLPEEPRVEIQTGNLNATGHDLLIYSTQPALPKGELAVPKVTSVGKLASRPLAKVPAGAEELGSAEVVIPNVSIKNDSLGAPAGSGIAVVQAQLPPKPEVNLKKIEPEKAPRLPPLKDRLPLILPGIGPTGGPPALIPESSESPLEALERQGKTVYSTSMNSPNFTSKRGSWILRFAELSGDPVNSRPDTPPSGPARSDGHLTAPSAIVKVDPKYPPEVIREKVEGQVILYAVLNKDGMIDPTTVRIIRKLDPRLDVSARDALIRWKFKPSLKNGQPVDIQAEITIPFYYRDDWFKP